MITSIHNNKIKRIRALISKQSERKKDKVFIVEGKKIIDETPLELIKEIFFSESFFLGNQDYIRKEYKNWDVMEDRLFNEVSTFTSPEGILAIVKQETKEINDLLAKESPIFIALEAIQDPGNMGTIIRTADAICADGLIISKGSVDIYNPKVVRATMGSIFRVPTLIDVDLPEIIKELKENGVNIYAAHLNTNNYYHEIDYKKATCFLIGNEGNGLSNNISKLATSYIKIPILGGAESLNASVAAGILMYEAIRQRNLS